MENTGKIIKVAGPLVIAEGMAHANMYDVVRVGPQHLIGEIIEMRGDRASIQVYEETAGIGTGEEVYSTGAPLSVELGPGLIGQIYDGIQRPLEEIRKQAGDTITRGIQASPLSRQNKWEFKPLVQPGAKVVPGDVLGTVQETIVVQHKIMVPSGVQGTVKEIHSGSFTALICRQSKVLMMGKQLYFEYYGMVCHSSSFRLIFACCGPTWARTSLSGTINLLIVLWISSSVTAISLAAVSSAL